jgi:CBS domain-containing protein
MGGNSMATIREVMTPQPVTLPASASLQAAALLMREHDIGDVLVVDVDGGSVLGVVTDRDLVVRGLAAGEPWASVGEVCSTAVLAVSPDDEVSDAVRLMTDRSVRRLAVVQDGELVGVVSLGDLASEFDPASALGEISRASAND